MTFVGIGSFGRWVRRFFFYKDTLSISYLHNIVFIHLGIEVMRGLVTLLAGDNQLKSIQDTVRYEFDIILIFTTLETVI